MRSAACVRRSTSLSVRRGAVARGAPVGKADRGRAGRHRRRTSLSRRRDGRFVAGTRWAVGGLRQRPFGRRCEVRSVGSAVAKAVAVPGLERAAPAPVSPMRRSRCLGRGEAARLACPSPRLRAFDGGRPCALSPCVVAAHASARLTSVPFAPSPGARERWRVSLLAPGGAWPRGAPLCLPSGAVASRGDVIFALRRAGGGRSSAGGRRTRRPARLRRPRDGG